MSNDTILYTVGEVAERFSLTVRTLRHWEAQGLLAPTARSWSNYRLYSAEDCARVQRIVIYRATGMKLIDIKSLLDSGDTAVEHLKRRSSPVEWCNRFVSFGVGYALSWSGGSSCPVGWGVSRDLVRMSRLR